MKEKFEKCILGDRENYSKPNKEQKSQQRDKHLVCLSCKILGTILEVRQEELQQMDQRTRNLMMRHQVLDLRDDMSKLYVSRKERGRIIASFEDSVDTLIRPLEENIKRTKRGLLQRPDSTQTTQG